MPCDVALKESRNYVGHEQVLDTITGRKNTLTSYC